MAGLDAAKPIARFILVIGLIAVLIGLTTACESTPERVGFLHSDGVRRVTAKQAKMLVDQDRAVLVDTRGPLSFVNAHASGAISAPAANIEQNPVGMFAKYRPRQGADLLLHLTG